jgi:hypothetical protein
MLFFPSALLYTVQCFLANAPPVELVRFAERTVQNLR